VTFEMTKGDGNIYVGIKIERDRSNNVIFIHRKLTSIGYWHASGCLTQILSILPPSYHVCKYETGIFLKKIHIY